MTDDRGVRTGPLTSVTEHQAKVDALVASTPVRTLALEECLGQALADDVTAPIPLPPFDNAAMDGYAVHAEDLNNTGNAGENAITLPVPEDIPAGRVDHPRLRPGTAHRIMTGARVPPGAASVVPMERTDGGTEHVRIEGSVRHGANIRGAGEDVVTGTTVLTAGTSLGASQLGVAAAVGQSHLPVHQPPRVLVLSTGSELVAPGNPLQQGQIYESNGLMLAAAVRAAGAQARLLRFVPDDVDAFHAAIIPELESTDVILTSGGVSAGAYEVVKDALTGRGVEFDKIAMQPGKPQGAGRYENDGSAAAVITLPGNPVSAVVSFEVFVRPALRRAGGHAQAHRPIHRARLSEELTAPAGKRQFRRGRFDPSTATATTEGGPGSHLLSSLAHANCLLEVPEDTTHMPEGSTVDVWLLD